MRNFVNVDDLDASSALGSKSPRYSDSVLSSCPSFSSTSSSFVDSWTELISKLQMPHLLTRRTARKPTFPSPTSTHLDHLAMHRRTLHRPPQKLKVEYRPNSIIPTLRRSLRLCLKILTRTMPLLRVRSLLPSFGAS